VRVANKAPNAPNFSLYFRAKHLGSPVILWKESDKKYYNTCKKLIYMCHGTRDFRWRYTGVRIVEIVAGWEVESNSVGVQ
jgi:hypothetical protein